MKTLRNIPGPKRHPLVGNVAAMRRGLLPFFTRLGRDYPELARIRYFHMNMVSVHTPELVEQILIHKNEHLHRSFDFKQLHPILGKGILTSDGDHWRRNRRLIQPSFRSKHIAAYTQSMTAHAIEHMRTWSDGDVLNIYAELSTITMALTADVIFGVSGRAFNKIMAAPTRDFMARFNDLATALIPLPLSTPTPANRRIMHAIRRLNAFLDELVAERHAREHPGDDILGRLLLARDEHGGFSPEQLRDELKTLLIAGQDTVTLALTYSVLLLGQHPEEFDRVAEEADSLNRIPTVADLERLPHTLLVIDEAMRLYPPIWASGRSVIEPFELAGYHLPKGTQVIVAPWILHRDHRYFNQPYAFRPDRWLAPDWPKSAYFPYLLGPRKCIGAHLGRVEVALVLATLVQKYRFDLVDDPNQLALLPSITLQLRDGLKIRVRARS